MVMSMPKMRSKKKALELIFSLGERLERLCAERGVSELTAGRGELRSLLNIGSRRGKDLLTMALQQFAAGEVVKTPRWELRVRDWEKPVICFRTLAQR